MSLTCFEQPCSSSGKLVHTASRYFITFLNTTIEAVGPGSSVGIATELRAGRSEDRIPVETRFSARPDWPCGPPSSLYNVYRVFPGGKERPVRDADRSTFLVPLSRKSRAILLLPLRAVRPVQSLSACTRVHFTYKQSGRSQDVFGQAHPAIDQTAYTDA